MKKLVNVNSFFLFIFLTIAQVFGFDYTPQTLPNPRATWNSSVCDPENILPLDQKIQIDSIISSIEQTTTVQIAVVIVNSIGDLDSKEFTTELFNLWGIGHKENDNGLLILTILNSRSWEIETGYGLEGVLPDGLCGRTGREFLVPQFREGKYGQGLLNTLDEFKRILENPNYRAELNANLYPKQKSSGSSKFLNVIMLYLLIGSIVFIFPSIKIINSVNKESTPYDKFLKLNKQWLRVILFGLLCIPGMVLILIYMQFRLRQLRYLPRKSSAGYPMRLLSDTEEDIYLSEGRLKEEEVKSVDYDVWFCDITKEKLILSYDKMSSFTKCPKCNFKTFKRKSSTTIKPPSYTSSGLAHDNYECAHCKYHEIKERVLPKLECSSSGGSSSGRSSFSGGRSGGGGARGKW